MGYNPTICNPDDYMSDPDALRETVRGNLTGADISEAVAWSDALGHKLDALMLLASVSEDECDLGRQFKRIVMAAVECAIDAKVRQ